MGEQREGPEGTTYRSCLGCKWETSEKYRARGDSGIYVRCRHTSFDRPRRIGDTTWKTPEWCPVSPIQKESPVADVYEIARAGLELAEKATPGPWKLWGSEVRADPKGTSDLKDSVLVCDPAMKTDPENGRLRCPDSYFIAHAGTHYAALCRALLAQKAVVEAAVEYERYDSNERNRRSAADHDEWVGNIAAVAESRKALMEAVRAMKEQTR